MDPVTQHLISSYLLMPVLTVIFGIAAYFIARKNKLLNNKKLIVYLLLCGIVLALPGLSGFMDYNFIGGPTSMSCLPSCTGPPGITTGSCCGKCSLRARRHPLSVSGAC